jgi:hypothetical protein
VCLFLATFLVRHDTAGRFAELGRIGCGDEFPATPLADYLIGSLFDLDGPFIHGFLLCQTAPNRLAYILVV